MLDATHFSECSMNQAYVRSATGILAILFLLGGVTLSLQNETNPFWAGTGIRVGCLLGVIWLAYDQIQSLRGRLPTLALAFGLVAMMMVATRPKIATWVIALLTIAFSVNGVLRWLSRIAGPPRPVEKRGKGKQP